MGDLNSEVPLPVTEIKLYLLVGHHWWNSEVYMPTVTPRE